MAGSPERTVPQTAWIVIFEFDIPHPLLCSARGEMPVSSTIRTGEPCLGVNTSGVVVPFDVPVSTLDAESCANAVANNERVTSFVAEGPARSAKALGRLEDSEHKVFAWGKSLLNDSPAVRTELLPSSSGIQNSPLVPLAQMLQLSFFSHQVYLNGAFIPFATAYSQLHGAAIMVRPAGKITRYATTTEVVDSLCGLQELPPDYLSHIAFPTKPKKIMLPAAQAVSFDFADAGDNDFVDSKYALIPMSSYRFRVHGKSVDIQIPLEGSQAAETFRKQGYYIVSAADVIPIFETLLQIVPLAFFPPTLKLVLTPFALKENTAAISDEDENHVIIGNTRTKDFKDWFLQCLLPVLQHEMAHLFHASNNAITSLLLRCMALDGWTMEYGVISASEYFAVLAENFFDHPERREIFPNGYRLLYTLIKARENGVRWTSERTATELKRLASGLSSDDPTPLPKKWDTAIVTTALS